TVVRVARYSGRKRPDAVRTSVAAALTLAMGFILVISVVLVSDGTRAFAQFSTEPAVLDRLVESMGLILGVFAVDAASTVLIGGLRSLGDRWVPQTGYGLILLLLGVPLAFLVIHGTNGGVMGLFRSLSLAYGCAALFVFLRARGNPHFRIT